MTSLFSSRFLAPCFPRETIPLNNRHQIPRITANQRYCSKLINTVRSFESAFMDSWKTAMDTHCSVTLIPFHEAYADNRHKQMKRELIADFEQNPIVTAQKAYRDFVE